MLQAEAHHRDHAIVEQVFADLVSGPVAHLPSGHFPANAAWLALAAICHNLTRAAGSPAHSATSGPGPDQVTITTAENLPARPRTSRRRHCPRRDTAGHSLV